jgi:cell division protein FtsB
MNDQQIEALLNGRYGTLTQILVVCISLLWAMRKGYLVWSKDKVSVTADEGSIAVLQSMQREIERLNEQLTQERLRCDKEIASLKQRVSELEKLL